MSNLLSDTPLLSARNMKNFAEAGCCCCKELPQPLLQGPGTLYLKFPLAYSQSKILSHLLDSDVEYDECDGILSIAVSQTELAPLLLPLKNVLSSVEQDDVHVFFQPHNHRLELSDCFEADTLNVFLARAQSRWLLELMSENRLTSWFQPIVSCKDKTQVFAYECLMRGIEDSGNIVLPGRILDVARGAGLLFQLDRVARLTAIRCAAHNNLDTKIFINFAPTAIYDPIDCLKSTVAIVDEFGIPREQVVFEVLESEAIHDTKHLRTILDYYRGHGFGIALDDVGTGYSSLNMLSELRPDYLKMDMEMTRNVHTDPYKATIARKLLETAHEIGVKTIAEGIETEQEAAWLCLNGADYMQGYFYAYPAAIPPLASVIPPLAA